MMATRFQVMAARDFAVLIPITRAQHLASPAISTLSAATARSRVVKRVMMEMQWVATAVALTA